MAAQAIVFNELEWRNAKVTANAGQLISNLAKQPARAMVHYRILTGLHTVAPLVEELLAKLHSESAIVALEAATPEQRTDIGRKLQDAHDKLRVMITTLRHFPVGRYWKKLYLPKLRALEVCNAELRSHYEAIRDTDGALILLSKADQEFLLEALLHPVEPREEIKSVFAPKRILARR